MRGIPSGALFRSGSSSPFGSALLNGAGTWVTEGPLLYHTQNNGAGDLGVRSNFGRVQQSTGTVMGTWGGFNHIAGPGGEPAYVGTDPAAGEILEVLTVFQVTDAANLQADRIAGFFLLRDTVAGVGGIASVATTTLNDRRIIVGVMNDGNLWCLTANGAARTFTNLGAYTSGTFTKIYLRFIPSTPTLLVQRDGVSTTITLTLPASIVRHGFVIGDVTAPNVVSLGDKGGLWRLTL